MGDVTADRDPLARSTFRRSAKLASLPLGFAGRATVGLGQRMGGASAEAVAGTSRAVSARTVTDRMSRDPDITHAEAGASRAADYGSSSSAPTSHGIPFGRA